MRVVSNYAKPGKNFYQYADEGKIIVKAHNKENKYIIKNGDVYSATSKNLLTGETKETVYGEFTKTYTKKGKLKNETLYQSGTVRAKKRDGIFYTEYCKLGSYYGKVIQTNKSGGIYSEEFIYNNNKKAYKINTNNHKGQIFYPNGQLWAEYTGRIRLTWRSGSGIIPNINPNSLKGYQAPKFEVINENIGARVWNSVWNSDSMDYLFQREDNWSMSVYDKKGKIKCKGQCENRQAVGEWIRNYESFYFLQGILCPAELYYKKPEELDSAKIMEIQNVQLRSILAQKKGYESILRDLNGTLVDTEGEYTLYSLPIINPVERGDKVIKLLKVKCPSTGAYYTLRVPPECTKVNQARQWTFGAELQGHSSSEVNGGLNLLKET